MVFPTVLLGLQGGPWLMHSNLLGPGRFWVDEGGLFVVRFSSFMEDTSPVAPSGNSGHGSPQSQGERIICNGL